MMEKGATIEVFCDGTTEEFETANAATLRYKELEDLKKSPVMYMVRRHRIIF